MNQRFFPLPKLLGRLLALALCSLFWLGSPSVWAQENGEEEAEEPREAEEEPEEEARFASRERRDRALLAQQFPGEAQWLELPAPQAEALALYRPAESAAPKGALLLLHTADNPPHWPLHLDNLRRALPRQGWATLALTLPLAERTPVPARPEDTLPRAAAPQEDEGGDEEDNGDENGEPEEAAEPEPEPEPEEPLPPRAERVADHLDAALLWLAQEGQGNLVVLVDPRSAPEVLAHLEGQLRQGADGEPPATGESPLSGPIRALVMVSTRADAELSREQLDQVFAVAQLPVLDVFLGPGARLQERRRQHRDASRRQRLRHYQALEMSVPDLRDPEQEANHWVRRIHAYMQRQAEGIEVQIRGLPSPQ